MSQDPVVAFLSSPAAHAGAAVERISTHGAHIFLAGDLAFKLKREIAYSFMDFSTTERRRAVLERELALNRPAAPDLYLETRPIYKHADGAVSWAGDGTIVDWVLVMRRFEQSALLDAMAQRNAITPAMIDDLASVAAVMHRSAEVVKRDEYAAFMDVVADTLAGLTAAGVDPKVTKVLEDGLRAHCARLADHMAARSMAGFVRRCHGDLHLRNIVLHKGKPTPFDALEFDDGLATGDVYYDLAFLLMDLDHRGFRPLANRLLGRYAVLTDDLEGLAALPLYIAMRAAIRARVALLAPGDESGNTLDECNAYLALAVRYLQPSSPCVVAIGGLSGTGKSSVAYELADALQPAPGGIILRSDVLRKLKFETAETQRLPESAYGSAVTDEIYRTLNIKAARIVAAGYSAVVDAVFARPEQREAIEDVAERQGKPFHGLWLQAALDVRTGRISERPADASDATVHIAERQEAYALGEIKWRCIDASGSLLETRQKCSAAIGGASHKSS